MARRKRVDCSREDAAVDAARAKHGIEDVGFVGINLYCYNITLPLECGDKKAEAFANDIFHAVGAADDDLEIAVGEGTSFCELIKDDEMGCYCVIFNHHDVVENSEELFDYSVEALRAEDEPDDEERMQELADAIKSGRIRSKSGEGYFVLKGEYFDAIKSGRKTTEYREITPRNLSKSIGIKTVKFQRGYGHPGQPPEQMRFEVKSVMLMDPDGNECDPYNIPDGFIATTIAIHLGRIKQLLTPNS